MFTKATKHESKLRLAITGAAGSGKTYTALNIAKGLGSKIALVDTEHGSASKYADVFSFDVLHLDAPFHPNRFVEAINSAATAGYDVIILDSLTHAWNGSGGLLEIVDDIAKRMRNPNSFAAWKDATPIYNKMVETIIAAKIHVIATMRSKSEYVLETNEKGRQTPRKVGMAAIQREGFEYEFDVVLDMDADNTAVVSKTRCSALTGGVYRKPGGVVSEILSRWLSGEPAKETPPTPTSKQAEPTKTAVKKFPKYTTDEYVKACEVTASDGEKYGARPDDKLKWVRDNPKSPDDKALAATIILHCRANGTTDEPASIPSDSGIPAGDYENNGETNFN